MKQIPIFTVGPNNTQVSLGYADQAEMFKDGEWARIAAREPVMLTTSEKYQLWLSVWDGKFNTTLCNSGSEVVEKIVAAFITKQKPVRKVKIYIYQQPEGGIFASLCEWPGHKLIDSSEREIP